ncbi:hypothetical protein ACIQF6_18545 [Kitasatospora sp. NPDC092948]|uniref:hypothetical protein n=1 Tax=Kitasatospora sp. NPDC092948 TaxID=3364088 RepID=UPI0038186B9B
MTNPLPANTVETAADFGALLARLSRHCAELGPAAPDLDDVLLRWAAALPDRAPEPGWHGLADQLLGALAAPPAGRAEPAPLGDEPDAATSGELRALLRALAADFARDRDRTADRLARGLWAEHGEGWASGSSAQFLEAWEAWLEPSREWPQALPGVTPVEPVTWASVARQLGAARSYE